LCFYVDKNRRIYYTYSTPIFFFSALLGRPAKPIKSPVRAVNFSPFQPRLLLTLKLNYYILIGEKKMYTVLKRDGKIIDFDTGSLGSPFRESCQMRSFWLRGQIFFTLLFQSTFIRGNAQAAGLILCPKRQSMQNAFSCAISPKAVSLIPPLRLDKAKRYFPWLTYYQICGLNISPVYSYHGSSFSQLSILIDFIKKPARLYLPFSLLTCLLFTS
jgi:hypothetical protein